MGGAFDTLCNTTDPNHLPSAAGVVTIVSFSDLSSEDDIAVASPLGTELSDPGSSPSAYAKNTTLAFNTVRGDSTPVLDGLSSADDVRSTSEHGPSACSPTKRPTTWSLAKQPSLHPAVDMPKPSMMDCWERVSTGVGVGGQLPTIKKGAITLDQAIVWPSPSNSTHIGEASGATDVGNAYGEGQIIGHSGDIILSSDPPGE